MKKHSNEGAQLEKWAEEEEALIERMREEAAEIVAEEQRLIDRWVKEEYGDPVRDQDRDLREEELEQREEMQGEQEGAQRPAF